jgi:hypothetical protein
MSGARTSERRASRRAMLVRSAASVACASVFAMAAAAMTGSCASSPDSSRATTIVAPDYNQFKATAGGVSGFLEQRCATLDCHGQVGRPLRLYSRTGLRFPDPDVQNAPGGPGVTEEEHQANYEAVIGLEPEQISRVVLDPTNNPPQTLLLVKKPRAMERHKGGQVVIAGDDGDTCITSWLSGATNVAACQSATAVK